MLLECISLQLHSRGKGHEKRRVSATSSVFECSQKADHMPIQNACVDCVRVAFGTHKPTKHVTPTVNEQR